MLAILVIACGALIGYRYVTKLSPEEEAKAEAVVIIRGKEYARYPLNKDQVVEIPADFGSSTLEIKDGKAHMVSAGCPDQICVHHAPISVNYDMIVCIPNEIIIKVEGGEDAILDSVAQ